MRDWPEGSLTDSTINHVYRSWWWEARGDGSADQAVWRAYTIDDAKDRYGKLRKGQYLERLTPRPYEFFVPFEPPIEIEFQSEVADSFYIACGWYEWAYCEVIARYGNYVTELTLDLEAEIDGHQTPGLTYGDISRLLQAMDKTFSEFLAGAGHGAGEE